MKIKHRIFFYNTVSVLTALVALLVVSGVIMHFVADSYARQGLAKVDDRSLKVQTLLNNWTISPDNWHELDLQLQQMDYSVDISLRGRSVYSSLNPMEKEMLKKTQPAPPWPEGNAVSIQNAGMLMVGMTLEDYVIVSMPRRDMPMVFGRPRLPEEAAAITMVTGGISAILVIVLLSLVFTNYQAKKILRPINALAEAAQRIEQGDFSQPVDYKNRDEFASVCAAFDHMQQHLLSERQKSAAYEQARTDLVAGISHDLRTPLTSVKGYIKGLRDGVAQTAEKQAQYLDIAYRKACDMDVLLQRLFYFSKLETGNLPLFPEDVELGTFVRRFSEEIQEELEQSGGQVVLEMEETDYRVRIDTEQMYRVLVNLKENAIRYAGAAPLRLTLSLIQKGDKVHLLFADNGKGVPEEQLPRLFEQFWRGDRARSSQTGEGNGLGLYIVKYLVDAHGGTIQAKNNNGLTFEIVLPCREEQKHE